MAELRPVSGHPGVGIVRAPASEKPRRFISTSQDGLSGFWTSKSDEELAADAAAAKAQHDAHVAQSLQWHPSFAAERQAAQEAAQQRAFDERWPDPRQSLRDAHAQLREVEATLARCREHATAAAAHTALCEAEVKHSSEAVEEIRRAQAGRLRARLAGNGDTSPDDDDPAHAEVLSIVDKADRALSVALTAQAGIAASVQQAEDEVGRAKQQVEAAAAAVIEKTRQTAEAEWSAAQQVVTNLQSRMISLRIDTRYSAQTWPAPLRALLTDPEAII
jgi:hypothetical protein